MPVRYNRSLTGTYNITPPSLQDGDSIETQVDSRGRLLVSVDTLPALAANSNLQTEGNSTLYDISDNQATAALQVAGNAALSAISAKLASTVAVTGPATDAQLRAAPIPVSGTFFPATQPVSGTFFPPVQPVSGTFFQATQPVSLASAPLPVLASTSTLQSAGNTSLAAIEAKTPALVSGRQPVDGSGVTQPVSLAAMPPDAATATNQGIANIYLSGAAKAANQVLNGSALQAALTVALVAVPMRVGASNQVGRKSLIIQANSAGYSYGYSAASQPFSLANGTPLVLNLGENITIWAVKSSGTNTITVAEIS